MMLFTAMKKEGKKQKKITGLNKFLRVYYARVTVAYQ
jgi:hypothetical protein